MADCDDGNSNTSDEHLDPHCEPCFDSQKHSVHVYGYCHECYQFMCSDCHVYHGKFPSLKNHVIVRGSEMPKSLADKPPKYERCYDHPREWKAKFCYEHKTLVCSTCSDSDHIACNIKSVDDVCKTISSSYLDELDEAEKNLCDEANCVIAAVESSVGDLEEQRKTLLQEIQNINTKVNIMLENVKFKVAA